MIVCGLPAQSHRRSDQALWAYSKGNVSFRIVFCFVLAAAAIADEWGYRPAEGATVERLVNADQAAEEELEALAFEGLPAGSI